MTVRSKEIGTGEAEHSVARYAWLVLWPVLAVLALALALGAVVARIVGGGRYDDLLMLAAAAAAAVLAARLLFRPRAASAPAGPPISSLPRELLESAGAAILAVDLEGRLVYVNSAAERLLGYHAAELTGVLAASGILSRHELERVVVEMRILAGISKSGPPSDGLDDYLECVRALPEPADAADALAIAICHVHTAQTLAMQAIGQVVAPGVGR